MCGPRFVFEFTSLKLKYKFISEKIGAKKIIVEKYYLFLN